MRLLVLVSLSGYVRPQQQMAKLMGRHLRVGGFNDSWTPLFTLDPGQSKPTGFYGELMDELAEKLSFSYTWVLFSVKQYSHGVAQYHEALRNGTLDLFVDWPGPGVNLSRVHSTVPIVHGWMTGLLPKHPKGAGIWQLFMPFSPQVWIAVLVIVLLLGVSLLFIDSLEGGQPSIAGLQLSVYVIGIKLLGGEDSELSMSQWKTSSRRILRIGVFFFVLILGATYTANLAAFLTAPDVIVTGPRTASELRNAVACSWTAAKPAFTYMYKPYVGKFLIPDATEADLQNLESSLDWCHAQVMAGNADVIFDYEAVLDVYNSKKCRYFAKANFHILPQFYGLMLYESNHDLESKLNAAILNWQRKASYSLFIERTLHVGSTCLRKREDSSEVHMKNILGLFIITIGILVLAVLSACYERRKRSLSGHTPLHDTCPKLTHL